MSEENKNRKYIFRLSETDNKLFEKNFELTALSSKAEFVRKIITNQSISTKLDAVKLNEIRRLSGLLGKNTGILKMYIMELDEVNKKSINQVINDNEKLKKEIRQLVMQIKTDLGI